MSRTIKAKKTGGKAVAHSCRNNGTCNYCTSTRTITALRRGCAATDQLKDIEVG